MNSPHPHAVCCVIQFHGIGDGSNVTGYIVTKVCFFDTTYKFAVNASFFQAATFF